MSHSPKTPAGLTTRQRNKIRKLELILLQDPHKANAVAMNPTVFVQAMLPHREQFAEHEDGSPVLVPTGRIDADGNPEVRRALAGVYSARNGDLTLTVRSGYRNGQWGTRPESIGIPYGGMARLLLTWIVTEASKRNEQTLDLGETLTSFFDHSTLPRQGERRDASPT